MLPPEGIKNHPAVDATAAAQSAARAKAAAFPRGVCPHIPASTEPAFVLGFTPACEDAARHEAGADAPTSGEPAAAVERAVLAHPRVREVAVVGVPDGALGERVVAAVVLEAGAADRGAVWEALPQLMRDAHLPQYARPRGLAVRDALPRNSMGKVVKHRLQRELGVHGGVGIL